MLLRGVNDIIKFLGRAVMAATSDEFLTPYVQLAQDGELTRALGPEMVAELDNQLLRNQLTTANVALMPYVQKVLAWYAYLHYLPFSIGNDGDNGLQEMGTESTSPVRIGVLDKRLRETEKNAIESLEALLQFLEGKPAAEYPTYHNSATARRTRTLFLSSATAMSEYLPLIENNHRLFLNIRPYIVLAETDYILPRLGQDQYDALKASLLAGTTTADEKALLAKVARALAHTAYWTALPNLQFAVLPSGNIRVQSDFDGIYNRKSAPNETVSYLVEQAETESKKHLNALSTFLRKNAQLYPAFAASTAASREPANRLPDNSRYSKVFRMK